MKIFSTSVTTRLSIVKNIVALSLLATLFSTWQLWSVNRYYPVFPGSEIFSSVNVLVAFAIPVVLSASLVMIFLLRKPRFFTALAAVLCMTLLVLDAGRSYYWFYFYLVLLLLLSGYNWRVDNEHLYTSFYNAIKIMLAGIYVLAAAQHFQHDFVHSTWPRFIKPFERFWTPEQIAYLNKTAYVIPFIELFVAAGLFFNGAKIAAISFALLFHVFSFAVLFMQKPQPEIAVMLWHVSMILLIPVIFAGTPSGQKNHFVAFGFYPVFIMLAFGIAAPVYFVMIDKPVKNKIDLMQSNATEQYIYLSEENRSKLPLYVQSFAGEKEKEYYRLSVTRWVLHETNTRQVLGVNHLMQLNNSLNLVYGAQALVALPTEKPGAIAAR